MLRPLAISPLLLLAALAAAARADTLHVPQDFGTIQAAVDASHSGDTIEVKSGLYPGDVHIDSLSELTVQAKGKVRIDGTFIVGLSTNIALNGLQFVANAAPAVTLGFSNGVTLFKCRFVPAPSTLVAEAQPAGSVLASGGSTLTVDRCTFKGGSSTRLILGGTGPATNFDISHCRFDHCGDIGIDLVDASLGTIGNCSFRGLSDTAIRGEQADQVTITHATISDVGKDGIQLAGTTLQVDHTKISGAADKAIDCNGGSRIFDNVIRNAQAGINFADAGTGSVIAGNSVKNCGLLAIGAVADGLVIAGNTLSKDGFAEGGINGAVIALIGDGDFVSGNTITSVGGSGFSSTGDALILTGNRVTGAKGDGFELLGDDNLAFSNVALHSGVSGFVLEGTGEVLVANEASGSGAFDLIDKNSGQNTIDPSNDFGKTSP